MTELSSFLAQKPQLNHSSLITPFVGNPPVGNSLHKQRHRSATANKLFSPIPINDYLGEGP